MSKRALVAMALAFLVPGAGHLYLGRRRRGLAFLLIVGTMLGVGLAVGGKVYSFAGGALLNDVATLGTMGSGLFYLAGRAIAGDGRVLAGTFEHGTAFALTAGLMNLLLVLDACDVAEGRKP